MFSLQTGDSRWASQRVLQRLQYLSHWLQSQGLRSGHILALSGNTQPDYLSLVLAAWQLGVITLPLNAKLKPEHGPAVFFWL